MPPKSKAEAAGAVTVTTAIKTPVIVVNAETLSQVDTYLTQAATITAIADTEELTVADDVYKMLKAIETTIETHRKEAKAPVLDLGKKIDSAAKPVIEKLTAGREALGATIKAFVDEQTRIREEAEEKARKAQEEAAQPPDREVISDFGDVVTPPVPAVPPPPVVKSSAIRTKTTKELVIIDIDAVPMKIGNVRLWTLDETKCKGLLKAGVEISGLKLITHTGTGAKG